MNQNKISLKELNAMNSGTLMEQLQIEYLEAEPGFIKAKMPVNHRTKQPMGILHGGASIALAETVAGLGSTLMVDMNKFNVKGAQLSVNHIGSAKEGFVIAEANIIHEGKNTHLWDVDIRDDKNKPISICRITNFIIKK